MIFGILFLAIYYLGAYAFQDILNQWHPFGSYIFEALFCLCALFVYRKKFSLKVKNRFAFYIETFLMLLFGFSTYILTKTFNLTIPWDLHDHRMVFLLLIVGPLLEELIFRFSLWYSLESLGITRFWPLVIISTLFFSAGHFQAYFQVPEMLKTFVLFQTIYTVLISLWFSARYYSTRSFTWPLSLHFAFNLGFYLGLFS